MNCQQYIELGCFHHCNDVTLPIELAQGNYVLRFSFLNSIQYMPIVVGSSVTIDTSKLPLGEHYLTVLDESGSIQAFEYLGDQYELLKLTIKYTNEI